ncbi:MAG: hypothetical protein PUG77_02430 [Helicobacter bilis]|uniref:hypothetical protein n=1 Tax=Helicobacter bilis TaxID=37372 RepID=UPI0026EF8D0F|nr:hypothetical protein [Helicobacter bilis]MDD7296133.1 hypothetical protein [Helicobacter bilis]
MQDPIKSINKVTTKDGVEIYTLNTQKFEQKEPLTNLTADSKQLSQRTSQETKEIMLNHILENDKLLYLLKQGINTQHLSPFQKEILESALDIANNPTKLKEYKLQGLQKQLNNLNESEAYLKTLGKYDKARYAKDREELEREISALKGETSLATPKQKTIQKIDSYAKSNEFKTLNRDKQEAILSLKDIEPSLMPQEISIKDLEHLQKHFSDKLDKEQREKFLTLFKDTKENPHIVLEVLKNGEIRQEYIKAYQHKESKDLYYLAIGKNERDITGIPTTKLIKVINDIAKSERVVRAVNFEGISNTAAPLPKQTSPQRSSEIIPQTPKEIIKQAKQSGKV